MITIHDEKFNIIRSNKAAATILGLSWLAVGKAKCFQYYHGSDGPPERCPSCESVRTGNPASTRCLNRTWGGTWRSAASPASMRSGKMAG